MARPSMPGIEAQKAFHLSNERFPGSDAYGADARIVFVAPDGEKVTTPDNRTAIETLVQEAGTAPQVAGAVNPFQADAVSKDASTGVRHGDLHGERLRPDRFRQGVAEGDHRRGPGIRAHRLVSCARDPSAEAGEGLEDLVGCLGPGGLVFREAALALRGHLRDGMPRHGGALGMHLGRHIAPADRQGCRTSPPAVSASRVRLPRTPRMSQHTELDRR